MSDLTIMKLSHYSAAVSGGTEVILLCDRVAKEDIQVWFYEEHGSRIVWESQAEFQPSDVHKQVAISFRTPRYHNENVQQPVPVFVELRKPSEKKRGEPRPFQFLPVERDPEGLAHKKRKVEERLDLDRYFQGGVLAGSSVAQEHQLSIGVPRTSRQPIHQSIKVEPPVGRSPNADPFPPASTSYPEYSTLTTVPVSTGGPSTSPHLTPAHSPVLAASPGAHSQASATPPLTTLPSPIMQQMMQQSETPRGDGATEARGAEEEAIIMKFDSLDLDLNINLSASLFDSATSITDTTYQDAPTDRHQ